jgi:beta-lactamase class D
MLPALLCPTAFTLTAFSASAADTAQLARIFKGHDACFVVHDVRKNKTIRWNAGRSARRFTPCSTFKIPNALIALETGVAPDGDFRLKWDGSKQHFSVWEKDHTLRSAISVSCLWYFQRIAAMTGEQRMREHVDKFNYGNRDLSGGLTDFWLQSSLKISADEQVAFLRRLVEGRLPVSRRSRDIVADALVVSRSGDEIFRGKTGTAGDPVKKIATLGWFVGWHTKGKDAYIFAVNISGGDNPSGRKARELTRQLLNRMGVLSAGD